MDPGERQWADDMMALLTRVRELMDERDRRYGERFDAEEKAVGIALVSQERALTAALGSAKEAVLKAEAASEKRFEAVNEFRVELAEQARDLMPRLETEQRMAVLGTALTALTDRLNQMEGQGTVTQRQTEWQHSIKLAAPSYIFGAIGVLLGIAGFIYALAK